MHSRSNDNKGFDDFAKSAIWNTDDGAFLYCIVRVQDFLYVYWVDVGSATDDQILLPPDDIKEAVSAEPPEVSAPHPSVYEHFRGGAVILVVPVHQTGRSGQKLTHIPSRKVV